jgi:hypothetical protein
MHGTTAGKKGIYDVSELSVEVNIKREERKRGNIGIAGGIRSSF